MNITKNEILNSIEKNFFEKYGLSNPFTERFEAEKNEYLNSEYGLITEQLLGEVRNSLKSRGYHSFPSITFGSTFISYLLGVSDNNPLPLHYYCPKCKRVELIDKNLTPWDIERKSCDCGGIMSADGFNIPYESHSNMIELPFVTLFVSFKALEETYEIIRERLKKYKFVEEKHKYNECKVFTLLSYDKTDNKSDYLYYDNPCIVVMPKSSIDELELLSCKTGISYYDINFNNLQVTGKELDYGDLKDNDIINVKPESKYELLKICGLMHGTGTWLENGENLISDGKVSLSEIPAFREDIFNILIPESEKYNIDKKYASIIMRLVRTGRFARKNVPENIEGILSSINLPTWFMEYINKIEYMFSKPHGIELCKIGLALEYYKKQ